MILGMARPKTRTKPAVPETAKSDAALAVLETLAEVFRKLDAIGGLRERVGAMGIDAGVFAADVRDAAGRVSPTFA